MTHQHANPCQCCSDKNSTLPSELCDLQTPSTTVTPRPGEESNYQNCFLRTNLDVENHVINNNEKQSLKNSLFTLYLSANLAIRLLQGMSNLLKFSITDTRWQMYSMLLAENSQLVLSAPIVVSPRGVMKDQEKRSTFLQVAAGHCYPCLLGNPLCLNARGLKKKVHRCSGEV